jgi:uncharacterized protein (TIGR02147 family)
MHNQLGFIENLNQEFRRRRERNSAYSLRSFSRDLAVNPGRLSQYFSGQRQVTNKAAVKMMTKLGLSPKEQFDWLGMNFSAPPPDRSGDSSVETQPEPYLLQQKVFELIAEPIHFTLLSLLETRGFHDNVRWMAQRLKSTVPEVMQSLRLLRELGLLVMSKDGRYSPTHKNGVRSSDGVKNAASRMAHKKQMEQAIQSLDEIPLELRDITSITFAADPRKLAEAKVLIKEFRRKITTLFETTHQAEVYRLQVQLLPLTNISKETPHEA